MRNGRSAAVPGSNTVSMWPMSRTRGAARRPVERADDRVAEAAARVGPDVDVGAELAQEAGRPSARPRRRRRACTTAAVDVDEALEVGEVGRAGRAAIGRAQRVELAASADRPSAVAAAGHARRVYARRRARCYPAGTVRLVEIRLLEGPNVYRLEPVVKLEVAVGRRRTWYGQRDPARHALVRLGRRGPARATGPTGIAADRRLGPPPARATTARAAPAWRVHRSSDPGHWIVAFPWRGEERAQAIDRGRARRSPSGTSRRRGPPALTGAQERLVGALDRAHRRGRTSPPPWIRDADRRVPVVSISGHERQVDGRPG